ncbi:hypothetical protein NDU88_003472 [Pleurodeles waltl]|uniref:Homeobox domain-containing protein n=2 Tax=Pleurodeles waltl TaxID=8319 RepID=A0AAV7QCY0_PLEWA|nr:hypothetical protein NDU88_003472 [Pleurodeles waltl]
MEKVKTWFMVQRIRCGISWSSEEIEETRGRLLRSQDQLHFKPLVAMARRAAGRGPPPTEQRTTTRDTASSPAAFSSFRKTDVGKVEMVHRPPSLTALSSLANTRPPSLTGLSSLTNSRPPSLTGLSSLANTRPPSLTGLSSLANSCSPSLTGLSSVTNARPASLNGVSSLSNTRPQSLSSTPLYTSSVPPLHSSPRPLSHSTNMLPLQNNSRPPSYTNSGLPVQSSSGPPFYTSLMLPSHNLRHAPYTNTGLPLQPSSCLPYYTSTVSSQHNSRSLSYTNAGLTLQSSPGPPFYTSTTPPLQNNSQQPPYPNAGLPLPSNSGLPFYTNLMQSLQNPRPPSHSNVSLLTQANTSPPLYINNRPASPSNSRPPSLTSTRQASYSTATKESVKAMLSGDLQHHLSKRPRTEDDLTLDAHASHTEAMRESPQLNLRGSVSQLQEEPGNSAEHGYPLSDQWPDQAAHRLDNSGLDYKPHHQRSKNWELSSPFCSPSLEAQSQSAAKLPSAATGNMFDVDGTEVSDAVVCLPSEEELQKRLEASSWDLDGANLTNPQGTPGQGYMQANEDGSFFPIMRRQRKTKEQLAILKSFFLQCQWARREDYKKLEEITGLPRPEIIQWFGDTRYALKHGQLKWFRDNAQGCPGWLEQAQQQLQLLDSDDASPSLPATPPPAPEHTQNGTGKESPWKGGSSTTPMPPPPTNGRPEEPMEVQKQSSSPLPLAPVPRVDYSVLESYWDLHRQIKEGDTQRLVEESGLQLQQVQDWFQQKAIEPAEVEVVICLDDDGLLEADDVGGLEGEDDAVGEGEEDYEDEEDDDADEEDDDDDLIIQD